MTLRATQQYVSVLGGDLPALRITQEYLSILVEPPEIITRDAENSLSFSETTELENPFPAASNSFGFTQDPYLPNPYPSCSNSLSIEAPPTYFYQQTVFVTQLLGFTRRTILDAKNRVWPRDEFGEFPGAIPNGPVVHVYQEADAENTFGLSNTVGRVFLVSNTVGFSHTAILGQTLLAYNEFNFEETATTEESEFERDESQHCLRQSVSFHISGSGCPTKDYAPFVGSGGDPFYPVLETTPPVLVHNTLTLTFPVISPTSTLVLKNPEFGNTDSLVFQVINRQSRGGDQIVFSDPTWPHDEILEFTITNLCDVDPLIAFMNETLGQEIGMLDWEGQTWKGVLTAPDTKIVKRVSGYTVTLRFQGELT